MAKIVAVTSCPTGIAHTFMAAESLKRAAQELGHTIKVETQGSVGSQNTLTEADIQEADQISTAADRPLLIRSRSSSCNSLLKKTLQAFINKQDSRQIVTAWRE
jgi:fructose-specific phosphotransferase system IIB component